MLGNVVSGRACEKVRKEKSLELLRAAELVSQSVF